MLLDVGRLVLQVDARGSTGLRDARDRTALKRQAHAEGGVVAAVPHPDAHDHRLVCIVDVAHGRSGTRAEQPADLLRDGVEEPLGILLGRDGDRNAAEGSLLVGQGREFLAGLRVRECDGDEARRTARVAPRRSPETAGRR